MILFYVIIGVIIFFIVKLYYFIKNKRKDISRKRNRNFKKCLDFQKNVVKLSPYIASRDTVADYYIILFYTSTVMMFVFYLYSFYMTNFN